MNQIVYKQLGLGLKWNLFMFSYLVNESSSSLRARLDGGGKEGE